MAKWYDIVFNAAKPKHAEVYIYGVIGDTWLESGVTGESFRTELDALKDVESLDLHINSPGGAVYDGIDIYNQIMRKRRDGLKVNVYVDAQACSIASVIAMCGEKIYMPENAAMMIHDPAMGVQGGEKAFANAIIRLKIAKNSIAHAYEYKTGLSRSEIDAMMSKETWLSAKECVDLGFATDLESPVEAVALTEYGEELTNRYQTPPAYLTGQSKSVKTPIVEDKTEIDAVTFTQEQMDAAVAKALAEQAKATTNTADEITNLVNKQMHTVRMDSARKDLDKLVAADKLTPAKRDEYLLIAEAMGDKEVTKDGKTMNSVDFLNGVVSNVSTSANGHLTEHASTGKETTTGVAAAAFKVEASDIPRQTDEKSFVMNKYAERLMASDKGLKYKDAIYQAEKACNDPESEISKVLAELI